MDEIPCLVGRYFSGLRLPAGGGLLFVGAVDYTAVGQYLHVVGVVALVVGEMCAWRGVACGDRP